MESSYSEFIPASVSSLVKMVQQFPGLTSIRMDAKHEVPIPVLFCWKTRALYDQGGWPLSSDWPFSDMADHYLWATVPSQLKRQTELVYQPYYWQRTPYWEAKRQQWVTTFLSALHTASSQMTIPKDKKPLISVILSVYNEQNHIAWTLTSVLYQTMPYFEIIVINDGSTDQTEKEIKAFTDPRIRIVSHTVNKGKAYRLNEALTYANGDWVFELDGDDWLGPEALNWAVRSVYSQRENVALVYGDRIFWNEDSCGRLTVRHTEKGQQVRSRKQYLRELTPLGPRVYRRRALERVGGWPIDTYLQGRLYEDIRIVLHLLEHSMVRYIPGAHYHVRMRANSITNRHKQHFLHWKKWVQQKLGDQ